MAEKIISSTAGDSKHTMLKEILKGSLVSTLFSLLLVLFFALIANIFKLSSSIVPAVNAVIKGISVFAAALLVIKSKELGFVKGFIIGIGFMIISSILFLLLGGKFDWTNILTDLLIACGSGMIAGIISVNKKSKR